MKISKSLLFGLLTFGASVTSVFGQTPSGPPMATGLNKFLGGIYSNSQRANFTAYFNQVTPENAGKWGSVEGTRDVMNWTELDAAYALAKDNGFPFRFHVLVWGSQQPNWIESLPAAEQLEEIEEWFKAVAARYPAIDYLEVVNEPTHAPPTGATGGGRGNYIAALGGSGTTGWDWILNAFRMARLHFPATTKLVINEYSVTNEAPRMQTYIGIVNLLKAENLIDVVAFQGHYFSTRSYSGNLPATTAQMKASLDLLAETGLPIMVTEMDIDGGTPAAPDDATQLSEYQRIFPVLWEHPAVIGITLWGYRPGLWRNDQAAYLVLADGTERPAMTWLKQTVRGDRLAVSTAVKTQLVQAGGAVTLTAAANGVPAPTLQWQRNGSNVAGATNATLTLENVQPASTGLYAAVATNTGGSVTGQTAIVGLSISEKVIGTGEVVGSDIPHPNTKIFDQVLLTGLAEAITADDGQVTRTSFIDLDGDIVQVEFSGPGTLSLVAEGSPDRAPPTKYTQPNTSYITGHAGIVITGATEQTNVSVFTVGRATANDPTGAYNIMLPASAENDPAKNGSPLFVGHEATVYDGVADIAFIAIASSNGRFGGIRTANANYFAAKGLTGIYAPGVAFSGPVFIGDISAADDATPVIVLGNASDTRVTGGDLHQANGAAVEVYGIDLLKFVAGGDSHGRAIAAQSNAAVLMQGGVNVTADIVVNPADN